MSTILTGTETGYRKNFASYFGSCFIHLVLGIALGKYIDEFSIKFAERFKLSQVVYTIFQMFVMICVLFLIERYISFYFADEWQRTTPGIIFSFAFFVSQKRLTQNLENLL